MLETEGRCALTPDLTGQGPAALALPPAAVPGVVAVAPALALAWLPLNTATSDSTDCLPSRARYPTANEGDVKAATNSTRTVRGMAGAVGWATAAAAPFACCSAAELLSAAHPTTAATGCTAGSGGCTCKPQPACSSAATPCSCAAAPLLLSSLLLCEVAKWPLPLLLLASTLTATSPASQGPGWLSRCDHSTCAAACVGMLCGSACSCSAADLARAHAMTRSPTPDVLTATPAIQQHTARHSAQQGVDSLTF